MAKQLPQRPDLGQLKQQAKDLLRAARAHDDAALSRFRLLPAFAQRTTDDLARLPLALHDAQSVIAREHGFVSWNVLREHVEELTLAFDAAVRGFVEAATDGRADRAERLLARFPAIAGASFHARLVLGDADAIAARLDADPALATQPGGPRDWPPLLYVCHTSLLHDAGTHAAGLVEIARGLLAAGADSNARFPWQHHGVHRPVLWGAVCVTRLLPLADVLLDAGADPNDGVTLPLAASGGDVDALELLLAHGADLDQRWATDGSATLYAIASWSKTPVGMQWLVEHGADPDPVFERNGESPLHVAAQRGDLALAELLLAHGADVGRRRADGRTPYAVAELHGHRAVADLLAAHGASRELSETDRFVAACSRGDRESAAAMLARQPSLRAAIGAEHHAALLRAAERGDTIALETMLSCGFDPDHADDEIGKTALHAAAMEGRADAVRVLLAHGASVTVRDREFHATPLVWAAEGSRGPHCEGAEHGEVASLLIGAGSPVDWEASDEPSDGILDILTEWRRLYGAP